MKLLWCWRCRTEVPMLDDEEFQRAMALRGTGTGDVWQRQFGPVLQEYERLTGFHETNINAIYHHVASLYGPPCSCCGKPLRTPEQGFAVHVCSLFRDLVSQLYQHSN